jgi:hypothetical protein
MERNVSSVASDTIRQARHGRALSAASRLEEARTVGWPPLGGPEMGAPI